MPVPKILGKCKMSRTDGKPAIEIVYDAFKFKQTDSNEYTG